MIDASRGFKKDGNKNRLREQDIEKIVRTFINGDIIKGYSRFVNYSDILVQNAGNLNVPRYIQKIDDTLPQNIAAHLKGGIPGADIDRVTEKVVGHFAGFETGNLHLRGSDARCI